MHFFLYFVCHFILASINWLKYISLTYAIIIVNCMINGLCKMMLSSSMITVPFKNTWNLQKCTSWKYLNLNICIYPKMLKKSYSHAKRGLISFKNSWISKSKHYVLEIYASYNLMCIWIRISQEAQIQVFVLESWIKEVIIFHFLYHNI